MTTKTTSQNSPDPILKALLTFGLEERSARLYLSLLELGEATVLQLARTSGVERTVIYYLIKELRHFGLVREVHDEKGRLKLKPAPPERLLEIEKDREGQLKELLPDLRARFRSVPTRPRIQVFEGIEGIDSLYDDLIETMKKMPLAEREFLSYAATDEVAKLPIRNQEAFRKKRGQYGIHLRLITNDSELARAFQEKDGQELRESRILTKQIKHFDAAFVVYANKVAQYNLRGDIFVMLIENPELANLQRTVFELAWESAGRAS